VRLDLGRKLRIGRTPWSSELPPEPLDDLSDHRDGPSEGAKNLSSVFSTILAGVPCHTSFLSPILEYHMSLAEFMWESNTSMPHEWKAAMQNGMPDVRT
jgi:hypothetical protein